MFKGGIPFLLLLSIHFLFLWQIVWPNYHWWTLLGGIPVLGYFVFKFEKIEFKVLDFLKSIALFGAGFLLTVLAVHVFEVSPVYASALVGVVISFIKVKQLPLLETQVYAGSFAGMIAAYHLDSFAIYSSIVLFGGSLFYVLKDNFNGLGGKLGTIGFGALLIPVLDGDEHDLTDEIIAYVLTFDPIGEIELKYEIGLFVSISVIAALIVYLLNNYKGWGPVKASAIVSFVFAIPFEVLPISGILALVPVVFYGASFVGMASKTIMKIPTLIFSASIFGALFFFLNPFYNGFGGGLGTTACLSCLTALLVQKAFQRQPVRV